MNELDALLAEIVEASRLRRQSLRQAPRSSKPGRINLTRPRPIMAPTKIQKTIA